MKLVISLKMNDAAISDDPKGEVSRILREYVKRLENDGDFDAPLMDINGHKVGTAVISPE